MILKNEKEISEQEFYDIFVEYYSHHYIYSVCRAFAEADLNRLKHGKYKTTLTLSNNNYTYEEQE